MPNPIADSQTAAGNLINAAYGCMQAVWSLVVATLQYGDTSPAAQAAQSAVYDAFDAVDAVSVDDPCPGTCGTGLSSTAGALQSALGNAFEGSYDLNASLSTQASQAMAPYTAAVNAAMHNFLQAGANISASICACDMEATGGANDGEFGCYLGAPIAGGPPPDTQWWHRYPAECPTWNDNATPQQCQCYQDPM